MFLIMCSLRLFYDHPYSGEIRDVGVGIFFVAASLRVYSHGGEVGAGLVVRHFGIKFHFAAVIGVLRLAQIGMVGEML